MRTAATRLIDAHLPSRKSMQRLSTWAHSAAPGKHRSRQPRAALCRRCPPRPAVAAFSSPLRNDAINGCALAARHSHQLDSSSIVCLPSCCAEIHHPPRNAFMAYIAARSMPSGSRSVHLRGLPLRLYLSVQEWLCAAEPAWHDACCWQPPANKQRKPYNVMFKTHS